MIKVIPSATLAEQGINPGVCVDELNLTANEFISKRAAGGEADNSIWDACLMEFHGRF